MMDLNAAEWLPEKELFRTPEVRKATGYEKYDVDGLQSVLLESLPAPDGSKTFVFAYFALPSSPKPEKGYPAIVLQHGNTDTCFPMIAKRWADRGYAVIAYDHYGNLPETSAGFMQRPVVAESLQAKMGVKFQSGDPALHRVWIKNIWSCASHACTFLREQKEIDADRIFFLGVSLGAVNGLISAGLDSRFAGYICCYGCGFFHIPDASGSFIRLSDPAVDPAKIVGKIKMPVLWIVSPNDFAFGQVNWQTSIDHTPTTDNQAAIPGLTHGGWAANYPLAYRWVDHLCGRDSALPKLGKSQRRDNVAFAPVLCGGDGIKEANLCYTREEKITPDTKWETLRAVIGKTEITAELPADTTAFFFTATDRDYPGGAMPVSSSFTRVK